MQHFHVNAGGRVAWCVDGVEAAATRLGFERTRLIEDLERGCDKRIGCRTCPWHRAVAQAAALVTANVMVPMARAQLRLKQTPSWAFPHPTDGSNVLSITRHGGLASECPSQEPTRQAQNVLIGLVASE